MVALRIALLLVFAALLVFSGSLQAPFHLDDHSFELTPPVGVDGPWAAAFLPQQTRPIAWLTYWANWHVSRQPLGFHLVNLLLHGACVGLAWFVLRALLPVRAALIACGLFALHPLQTEAVAYIFARPALLFTFFCLLSLWLWLRGRRGWAIAAYAAALLSKEEAVAFPALLLMLHIAQRRDAKERPAIAVLFTLALAAGLRSMWATAVTAGSGAGAQAGILPFEYLSTQGLAILRYLWLMLVPMDLTIEPALKVGSPLLASAAWGVIALVLSLAARRFMGAKEGFWLIAGFVLLLPSSSIFPAADLAADRRMYFPLVAFGAAAGLILHGVHRYLLAGVAVVLSLLTFAQVRVWQSEQRLWMEAARLAPDRIRPKRQLARVLPPAQALPVLEDAKRLAPDDPRVAGDLGRLYLQIGRTSDALAEFGRALALEPNSAAAMNNRGVALLMLGQSDAAIADFQRALTRDRCLFDAYLNLARAGVRVAPPSDCGWPDDQRAALPK